MPIIISDEIKADGTVKKYSPVKTIVWVLLVLSVVAGCLAYLSFSFSPTGPIEEAKAEESRYLRGIGHDLLDNDDRVTNLEIRTSLPTRGRVGTGYDVKLSVPPEYKNQLADVANTATKLLYNDGQMKDDGYTRLQVLVWVEAKAGENWHEFVLFTIGQNFGTNEGERFRKNAGNS